MKVREEVDDKVRELLDSLVGGEDYDVIDGGLEAAQAVLYATFEAAQNDPREDFIDQVSSLLTIVQMTRHHLWMGEQHGWSNV